ncbi:hypothetical protein RHMOL_Rhmol01G0167800 [Rhododendron molle]|uniref:Uncharacterized protein n=1 Tax=Rhododendron molle TaxID=49168 RepID=A0ACC0Q3M5_RHOML|nr:hypothetical protein RHMOL_Rhmol01G0167800 [Rhododendron molle]
MRRDGGRRGGGRGDGGRSEGAGLSGTSLPALSWTMDVMTPQGAPSLVVVPRPSAKAPEFLAQAPPGYVKEMAEAMMGPKQLVRQYTIGHPPEVLPRAVGTMARGGASRGLRRKSLRFPARQVSSASSRDESPSKRARHSAGTEDEPIDVSEDETEEPTDVDLEATSGGEPTPCPERLSQGVVQMSQDAARGMIRHTVPQTLCRGVSLVSLCRATRQGAARGAFPDRFQFCCFPRQIAQGLRFDPCNGI